MVHIFIWNKVCFAQVWVFLFFFFQAQRSSVCEQHQHQTGSSVVPRPCAVVWLLKRKISSTTIEKCIVCSNVAYEDTNTEMVSHFYTLFNFEKISLEFNLRGQSQRLTFNSEEAAFPWTSKWHNAVQALLLIVRFSNIMTKTGGKKRLFTLSEFPVQYYYYYNYLSFLSFRVCLCSLKRWEVFMKPNSLVSHPNPLFFVLLAINAATNS